MLTQCLRYSAQHKTHFALCTFTFHGNDTQHMEPGHLGLAQTSLHALNNKYLVSQKGFAAIRLIKWSTFLRLKNKSNLKCLLSAGNVYVFYHVSMNITCIIYDKEVPYLSLSLQIF